MLVPAGAVVAHYDVPVHVQIAKARQLGYDMLLPVMREEQRRAGRLPASVSSQELASGDLARTGALVPSTAVHY